MRCTRNLHVACVRDQCGQLLGWPVGPNILAGIDKATWHAEIGQLTKQSWSLAVVPPAGVAQAIGRRIGMEDLATNTLSNGLEVLVIGLAPRAVVNDLAASDANHANRARWIAQRIGEGQVRAVAVSKYDPALAVVCMANRLDVR